MKRIREFLSKLLFCMQVAPSASTFLKLVWNTKFNRLSKSNRANHAPQSATAYLFQLNGLDTTLHLRTAGGDLFIFYEIFWRQVYRWPRLKGSQLRCIVDLGGNVGLSALFFHHQAPVARILTLEPDTENFTLLRKNLLPLIEQGVVTALPVAVSHNSEPLHLQKEPLAYNSKIVSGKTEITVPATSVNKIMQQHRLETIDLVKVDIEGFEGALFSGNLEWLNKVSFLIIEMHSAQNLNQCMLALSAHGFNLELLQGDDGGCGLYGAYRD